MARGLLMPRLPLLLQPTPRPTPGWCMDTTVLVATTATVATTVATHTTAMVTDTATTGASKKDTSKPGLTDMKCQQFLTTTCPMFSSSEKNQNVQKNILFLQTHCI